MPLAIAKWRLFPGKLRADLQHHYGRHIRDWHTGEMSSSELVDLIDGLPETSSYKGALRGWRHGVEYEWAPEEYRAAAVARQLAPLDDDGDMAVTRALYEAYFSPVERAKIEAKQQQDANAVAEARAHVLRGAYKNVNEGR